MEGETTRERLVSDLKTLVGDAEELLKATTNQAGEKVTAARQKIEQSLIEGKKALADAEKALVKRSKEYADVAVPRSPASTDSETSAQARGRSSKRMTPTSLPRPSSAR